ncbi:MAG: CDP-alcohol phosphatidyltransferase family protein, partial [Bacteroidota bacterium]
ILDCVDGQLARLTGIKSAAGRILDGLAGDLWFISIYISIALRLSADASHSFTWIISSLAGASNLIQSNVADFYKTAHLYFISPQKGAEFDTVAGVKAKYAAMPKGISKFLYLLYIYYTMLQAKVTPEMQNVLTRLNEKYGKDIPEDIRLKLRTLSLNMMPLFNITTFNGRSLAMLAGILFQNLWIYLFFEITVLNIVLFIAMNKYERSCKKLEV